MSTFEEYALGARTSAVYAGRGQLAGLQYATLGLAGEAGEVANQVKKIARDDAGHLDPTRRSKIVDELGDVLWYAQAIADEVGVALDVIAERNLGKLRQRAATASLHGDRREQVDPA